MVVQHNLRAMNSNRMLGLTASVQSKSTEKLSSGYKINRAADDAAGLSISEKMRKQIRGLTQASLNASDGVSAVQTAEGALNEVQDMLQRMNELAVKASNGTMSEDDRSYIQNEIEQLTTEIDRVAETTKFNESYLLKGDAGEKDITLEAHDAGIKGTLVDNGDGTATFTMAELKEGDKVSIGGKTYTIKAAEEAVAEDAGVESMSLKDMTTLLTNVQTKYDQKAYNEGTKEGVKVTIGDDVYTSSANTGKWYVNGTEETVNITTKIKQGASVKIEALDDKLEIYSGEYKVETETRTVEETKNILNSIVNGMTDATTAVDSGSTIKIADKTYTYTDNTGSSSDAVWNDGTEDLNKAQMLELLKDMELKDGDTIAVKYDHTTNSNDYALDFTVSNPIAEEAKEDTSVSTEITAQEAYELARQELYAANSIGDTQGTADVTFGTEEVAAEPELDTSLAAVNDAIQKALANTNLKDGDTITIGDKTYIRDQTNTKWYNNEGTDVTAALQTIKATAGDVVSISIAKDEEASVTYETDVTLESVKANLAAATAADTVKVGDTITINDQTYTKGVASTNTTGWYNAEGEELTVADWTKAQVIKEGDTVTINVAAKPELSKIYEIPKPEVEAVKPAKGLTSAAEAGEAQNTFTITLGTAKAANTLNFNLHVGSDADMTNKIQVDLESMTAEALGIAGLNVSDNTGLGGTYAVDAIQDAIQKISEQRSALGAVQNRLEHTIANLDNVVENTTAAESQIRDTDMATEMVKYSNNNILAQAGQAMLAQANQANQGVLSLLG